MILHALIGVPVAGGLLAWVMGRRWGGAPRVVALVTTGVECALALWMLDEFRRGGRAGDWAFESVTQWVPQWGISLHLAVDGLSIPLIALTALLGLVSVVASWEEITERQGFFHLNLLWCVGGIVGVFASLDMFLFYFFWELMIVPMYMLIAIWGHSNRAYASVKFFVFTQISGLLMLLSIVGLYVMNGEASGIYTFDYPRLLGGAIPYGASLWLMLGFLAAFMVKLPAFPVHTWLPDAHTEAPTAGSILLAGVLLKTGAYGLMRFAVPLFPEASGAASTWILMIAVAGIAYGALGAFSQRDLKRLVAYSSVSHMGFVLLGVYVWNVTSLEGAVMQMVAHGLGTGGLFFLVGALYERTGTRDIGLMGGLWGRMPRMGGMMLFFALASLGLPGTANFVAEFLVLMGTFAGRPAFAVLAAPGLVLAAVYSLWMMQGAFYGTPVGPAAYDDLRPREWLALGALALLLIYMGLAPGAVLDTTGHGIENVMRAAGMGDGGGPLGRN